MIEDLLTKYSVGNFYFPIKSNADGILVNKNSIVEILQKLKQYKTINLDQM